MGWGVVEKPSQDHWADILLKRLLQTLQESSEHYRDQTANPASCSTCKRTTSITVSTLIQLCGRQSRQVCPVLPESKAGCCLGQALTSANCSVFYLDRRRCRRPDICFDNSNHLRVHCSRCHFQCRCHQPHPHQQDHHSHKIP